MTMKSDKLRRQIAEASRRYRRRKQAAQEAAQTRTPVDVIIHRWGVGLRRRTERGI